jgi:predicted O-methyltransferase YrrM
VELTNSRLAFWLQRRVLLEKRLSFGKSKRRPPLLEPASAEFIAALAAGINSHHTLQVGCGLSTVALAVAAQTTGSCVLSVHHEKDKQKIVQYFLKELGLLEFVEFITEDSASFIAHREGVEFVLLSGIPERYIELFDLLKLRKGAVVVADNALDDATNDYIRHVRRQPGVESSTLPLNRGIEVTKIVCWEKFKREYAF